MGGVHGSEPSGVATVRILLDALSKLPETAFDQKVVVMPVANPDGYASRERKNAHGVDINRNFPEKGFKQGKKSDRFYGGATPASEPETKAIIDVVKKYNPHLVISLHAPMACINYSGPSLDAAKFLAKATGLEAKSDIGYPTPGSMGNYYGVEEKRELITLELADRNAGSKKCAKAILDLLKLPSDGIR
jgi:protein MpaA